jgi:hypothetical protein
LIPVVKLTTEGIRFACNCILYSVCFHVETPPVRAQPIFVFQHEGLAARLSPVPFRDKIKYTSEAYVGRASIYGAYFD